MTDTQIVELYWQRCETAIAATDAAYGKYCHSIAYRILGDSEDAREIVSDSYFKLWNSIPPQRPDPIRGFLGQITRQLAINRREQNRAKKRSGDQYEAALEELRQVADGTSLDPVEQLALREAMERFLAGLPLQSRRIFLKRYWYFQSVREIARDLDLGQSNVKMQLLRTREKLKAYLEKEELL